MLQALVAAAIALLCLAGRAAAAGIEWNPEGWARRCDFSTEDIEVLDVLLINCPRYCAQKSGCTHYAFKIGNTEYGKHYGRCHLKAGPRAKSDAVFTSRASDVCGLLPGAAEVSECSAVSQHARLLTIVACAVVANPLVLSLLL
ncbi:hypothetical protein BOX15_Mlig006765g1 [Macrostomum lignano]|uniref:Apple domain-containing protein n=1 Tax=Macrostomum lignano TaxID=282301 RepID=A0A267GUR0_9PLAT|nr:hypothetical protein BOX15_Mlig006765g1 [Macrostomum lignano]